MVKCRGGGILKNEFKLKEDRERKSKRTEEKE
jgi:hypothetical protein